MILALLALATAAQFDAPPQKLPRPLVAHLRHELRAEPNARFNIAMVDLNGDGRKEAIVQFVDGGNCSNGGCRMLILTPTRAGYRTVGDIASTRPAVYIADSAHHGWRDVTTSIPDPKGQYRGFKLIFDGRSYPSHPIAPPIINRRGSPGALLIAEGDAGQSLPRR